MFGQGLRIRFIILPGLLALLFIGACLAPETVMAAVSKPAVTTGDYYTDGDNIVLKGLIASDGFGSISEYGFYYARNSQVSDSTPELIVTDPDALKKKAGTRIAQGQNFSATLANLQPDTIYLYFAFVTNEKGTAYGEVKQFTTNNEGDKHNKPEVKTLRSSVNRNEVILYGEITSDGGEDILEYGFYYGTDRECSSRFRVGNNDIGEKRFNGELTGLRNNTFYYYRAYARNTSGLAYGSVKSFNTRHHSDYYNDDDYYSYGRPVVSTKKPVDQLNGTALYGYISSPGSSSITSYGFYWGTDSRPENRVEAGGDNLLRGGTFSYLLGYLDAGETYYVQAYARNSQGTSRGSIIRFTVGYNNAPTFSTPLVSDIGASRATFQARIGAVGSSRIREYGFVYGQVYGLETMVKVGTMAQKNSEYIYHASGLQRGSLYYVKTYIITAAGTSYGPEVVFIAY